MCLRWSTIGTTSTFGDGPPLGPSTEKTCRLLSPEIKGDSYFQFERETEYADGAILGSLYIISRVTAPSRSPVCAVRGFLGYGGKSVGPVRVRTASGANFQRRRCSQRKNRWSRLVRKARRPRPKVGRQKAVPANAIYRMFFETRERNCS